MDAIRIAIRTEARVTEPYVRPDVRLFLDYLNTCRGRRPMRSAPVEARRMILASRFVADAPTGELALIRDLSCPGPGGDIPLRLFDARAERAEPGRCWSYFHGGGFVFGDLDTHEPICAELARQLDMPVLAVDYRLAPEHPWPAGVEDAIAAARWAAGKPGGARSGRSPAWSWPATAPAAISRSSPRSRCATSRRPCRCSRNGRSIPPRTRARAIRARPISAPATC